MTAPVERPAGSDGTRRGRRDGVRVLISQPEAINGGIMIVTEYDVPGSVCGAPGVVARLWRSHDMGKIRPYSPRDKRRNNPRAEAMYELYCSGKSLSEVGKAFGVTRQTVYDMFRRRRYSLRSRTFLPTVIYNGETYSPDGHGYYRKTNGDRQLLHQVVWEDNYGPIPPGHDIHHKDGDKTNNDPSNLACLTPSDHTRHHQPLQPTVEKHCLFCGKVLVRRRNADGTLEVPAALAKRSYCDPQCAGNHRRGKPRGWSPCHD